MYSHNTFTFSGSHGSSSKALTRVNKSESINCLPPLQSKKVLDQVRERIRYLHFSIRAEETYLYWIRFFIRWSGTRHLRELGATEATAFLTFRAAPRKVAASTHRVALSMLLFL